MVYCHCYYHYFRVFAADVDGEDGNGVDVGVGVALRHDGSDCAAAYDVVDVQDNAVGYLYVLDVEVIVEIVAILLIVAVVVDEQDFVVVLDDTVVNGFDVGSGGAREDVVAVVIESLAIASTVVGGNCFGAVD